MATDKETTIFEFKIEQGDAFSEMEKTKKAIIGLKEEQAKLNKAYKDGQLTVEEFAQESVRVEQVMKKQTTNYSNLTKQVQGTKSKTDELIKSNQSLTESLNKASPAAGGFISGLQGMAKSAIAFIATPLGAVIGAIGLAIGALTAYFKGSQEGQDRFNRLATIGSAILGKFSDAVQEVGKFIFDNLVKGLEFLGKVLSFIIPGFDEFIKKATEFLNLDQASAISALEEEQRMLTLQLTTRRDILKSEIEAAKLRGESTRNAKDRAAAFKEVEDKVKELFKEEKRLAELDRDIAIARGELSKNQFEDNLKIEEAKARLAQLSREESAMLKENATKQLALNDAKQKEIELARQKASLLENERLEAEHLAEINEEEAQKLREHEMAMQAQKQLDAEYEMQLSDSLAELEAENNEKVADSFDRATQRRMAAATERYKLEQELIKRGLTAEQAQAKVHEIVEQNKLRVTSDVLSQATSLFKEHTVAYKVLASSRVIIDTYQAATAALKFINPIVGGIFAALTIAAGLANLAKINGVSLAGGGDFVTKGPTVLLVGDNPGGRERVRVDPLSGRGQTRVFGDGIAMAGGGSINGSIMAAAQVAPINAQAEFQNQLQTPQAINFVEADYKEFRQKIEFKEQLTTA